MKSTTISNFAALIVIIAIIAWVANDGVGRKIANPKAEKEYYPIEEMAIQKDSAVKNN